MSDKNERSGGTTLMRRACGQWEAKCGGADATVVCSDGRMIVVGDRIYHSENDEIARVIADALNNRLRLTDAEREAVEFFGEYEETSAEEKHSATLRGCWSGWG